MGAVSVAIRLTDISIHDGVRYIVDVKADSNKSPHFIKCFHGGEKIWIGKTTLIKAGVTVANDPTGTGGLADEG